MFETAVAKTAGVLSALLVVAIIAAVGSKSGAVYAILALVFMLPGYLLSVFDINCTAAGQCHIWSWIKTVFLVVSYVMILVIAVTASAAAKKTVAAAEPAAPAAPAATTTAVAGPAATTTTTTTTA